MEEKVHDIDLNNDFGVQDMAPKAQASKEKQTKGIESQTNTFLRKNI